VAAKIARTSGFTACSSTIAALLFTARHPRESCTRLVDWGRNPGANVSRKS
jgi:hypothetical protein